MKITWKHVLIGVPFLIIVFYALTYIPQKLIQIDSSEVSRITIFNGNSGQQIDIRDRADIDHIINDLNRVTFRKGKLSIFYMGYSFRTTIYNTEGQQVMKFIMNSEDTIRYRGFFHTATGNERMDYNYIKALFEK
jgi:hypothetical protein